MNELQTALSRSLSGLDATTTQKRANDDPARWTVQQIVEHLLLTYDASRRALEDRIAKGTPSKMPVTLQQRVGQWIVLDFGHFPAGRSAPSMVIPPASPSPASGDELAGRATDLLTRFDAVADTAEGLFGKQRAITHPVLGPLNVPQWRQFHRVHGLHHVAQIDALRAASASRR